MKEELNAKLKNVLKKAKYNVQTETYEIKKEDYIGMNLTNEEIRILQMICENKKIDFEFIRRPLPRYEDEQLFQEYNEVKKKMNSCNDSKELVILEERRIKLRNKIFTDNINLVREIIQRKITNIEDRQDKEDIYQIGYEYLLKHIDYTDELIYGEFTYRVSQILWIHLERIINESKYGVQHNKIQLIEKIRKEKNIQSRHIYPEELAEMMNINLPYAKDLLNLEAISNASSIEEERNNIEKQSIYNNNIDTALLEEEKKKMILRLLKTIPETHVDFLILYYGLEGNEPKNTTEIANMYHISRARAAGIILHSLKMIKKSILGKYLREYYESDYPYKKTDYKSNLNYKLEKFLLSYLPKAEFNQYLDSIHYSLEKEYLILRYENNLNNKEIQRVLDLPDEQKTYHLESKSIKSLRTIIMKTLSKNKHYNFTLEDYYDYLMDKYLRSCNTKKRKR